MKAFGLSALVRQPKVFSTRCQFFSLVFVLVYFVLLSCFVFSFLRTKSLGFTIQIY